MTRSSGFRGQAPLLVDDPRLSKTPVQVAVPGPRQPRAMSQAEPSGIGRFDAEQSRRLYQLAGLPEGTDSRTLFLALLEAIEEAREEARCPTPPPGHVVVSRAALEELEAMAAAPREVFLDEHRGRYDPANREAWGREYDRDPESARGWLATMPVNPDWLPPGERAAARSSRTAEPTPYELLYGEG